MPKKIEVILLAAGQGKRMKNHIPKVLLPLGGKPMLLHILDALKPLKPYKVHLVIGHGEEQVRSQNISGVEFVLQKQQLGTGHAVAAALKKLKKDSLVLVLYGDVPLIKKDTLRKLVRMTQRSDAVWCIANLDDPTGYGRILRDEEARACAIVEEKDCTKEQQAIKEANMGVMIATASFLSIGLKNLLASPLRNKQGEYLLTDLMKFGYERGQSIKTLMVEDKTEFLGANDMLQLAHLERILQYRRASMLAQQGVYFVDMHRVDVLGDLRVGKGVSIGPNVIFKGRVRLGDGVRIASHCVIEDCSIGTGTEIYDFCHLVSSRIGHNCGLGPYARIRPSSHIEDRVRIGNFVETKAVHLKADTKVSHLTYLGDSSIGEKVNIGAGTITCNYDGIKKNRTIIQDGVFIGSNTALIAPITIGKGAIVGAGSVI